MKKNDIHFEKKGTTMPEVLGQIPPDEKVLESIREKLGANSKIRDSTNPHDDPNLVGRLYTYRRIKLEKKLAHMSRPRGERRSSEGSFVTISSASK